MCEVADILLAAVFKVKNELSVSTFKVVCPPENKMCCSVCTVSWSKGPDQNYSCYLLKLNNKYQLINPYKSVYPLKYLPVLHLKSLNT